MGEIVQIITVQDPEKKFGKIAQDRDGTVTLSEKRKLVATVCDTRSAMYLPCSHI